MSTSTEIEELFAVMLKINGIDVHPEWREGVKNHLANAAKMAAIIENCNIDPLSLELSNTFRPGTI